MSDAREHMTAIGGAVSKTEVDNLLKALEADERVIVQEEPLETGITFSEGDGNPDIIRGFEQYYKSQTSLCPDNIRLMEILPEVLKLQNAKGLLYGNSYAKHGDVSIFLNIERKFDRVSNIMERALKEGTDILHSEAAATATETFLDTIVDLGVYSFLWVGYIKKNYPDEWEQFLVANKLK